MSEHDRGAYTPPTDEPLSFDARRPQGRRPMPMALVAGVIVLAVLCVAVVLFYRSGVRGANETPQVVGEPMLATKEPPPAEAQPVDEAAELQVYADGGQASAAPTFAPPPEQPQPRPAAPVVAAPVQSAQVALPTAPAAKATVAPTMTAAPRVPPSATVQAPAQAQAEARPAARPVQTAAAETPVVKAPAAAAGGAAMVQIGAFASQAVADAEFRKVAAAFASHTAGRAKRVEPVERNGSTLYRTAFDGFTKADAQAFCQALKASGRDCLVK